MREELAFALIKSRDLRFVFIRQSEVEHIQVFSHPFRFGRFCQDNDVLLHQSAGDDLRH